MLKHDRKFAVLIISLFFTLFGGVASVNASMIVPKIMSHGAMDPDFHNQVILTGNSSEIRRNGRDAVTKHNPNAALIGQMLGGAKSIDIDGLGRADISPKHYAYCTRKYGSYRIEDNTFLQFSGTRTECISPFYDGRQ